MLRGSDGGPADHPLPSERGRGIHSRTRMLPRFGDSEARPPSVVMSEPATRDEIIDPQNLRLWLDIDGQG